VPQPGTGGRQIRIIAAMKSEEGNRLGARGVSSPPRECSLERLQLPEIVGQIDNAVLEAVRRFSWRAFDRICDCFVVILLSIHDRIFGSEPPRPTDLEREVNRRDW
jgi:hypothetical protein